MSRTALILAAHGSRHEPAVAVMLREYAARIEALRLFGEVATAFHQGEPSFSTVLDGLVADDVTIVPFFTSAGYYTTVVLPRELSRNRRFGEVRLRLTAPVGTHPGMAHLAAARVSDLFHALRAEPQASARAMPPGPQAFASAISLRENPSALSPENTTLAIVGHGTERHRYSRDATVALARRLAQMNVCAEVIFAFLDEEPLVESIPHRASQPNVIVIPFLIGEGPHATRDLPRRLGIIESDDMRQEILPNGDNEILPVNQLGLFTRKMPVPQRVICDRPVGADPRIVDLVVDLAVGNQSEAQDRSSACKPKREGSAQANIGRQRPELTCAKILNRNWKGSLTNNLNRPNSL